MPRRFFALLLALLLPLQFAWSAAAAYCQHETAPALAQHLGHHDHVHTDTAKKTADSKLQIDGDCGYCNPAASHAAAFVDADLPARAAPPYGKPPALSAPDSAPPRAPDRPQWPRLA